MDEEIKKKIDSLQSEVEDLIRQYDTEKQALTSASAKTSSDVASKGIGFITEIVTESSTLGRLGSKLSKAAMDDKRKRDLKLLDDRFRRLLVNLVQKAKDSLPDVSIFKKWNPTPNSADLIRQFDKVQERSTIRGRANRLLQILAVLSSKKLIKNSELESFSHKEKQSVVEPGTPFSAKRDIDRILENSSKYAYLIDTYIDEKTLDILLTVQKGIPILVLTQRRHGWPDNRFIQHYRDFGIERPGFEIRISDSRLIHDRYILTDRESCQIGSSLKDFGKSMTTITILDESASEKSKSLFLKLWDQSSEFDFSSC